MQESNQTMIPGAFVMKLKTPNWRMCVVKQVPEQSSSCWMLFGQPRRLTAKSNATARTQSTFQMEFEPHQEITLMNFIADMAESDETELRLVLVREPPAVSCIDTLWPLQGQEMYRKHRLTPGKLVNSLHQDLNMLRISPQVEMQQQPQQPQQQHSMQTRSKTRTN